MKRFCEFCGLESTRKRSRFCSKSCCNKANYQNSIKVFACVKCGAVIRRSVRFARGSDLEQMCWSCISVQMMANRDQSGDKNPGWRGGSRYWRLGRHGKDKDGLSWKVQRRLAWERDNYACRECGKTRVDLKRNPDVHHVCPYRISRSHHLDNLKTLCKTCHKKADMYFELDEGRTCLYVENVSFER